MVSTYDARSFFVAGQRRLLISGEIHYARSPRAAWPKLLDQSGACGLNAIAAYVFWNVHEPRPGEFDFAGDHDLGHFLALCHERGLAVLLRMGPYCCAEWNYGGYPAWLRDEPGITIRTWSEPYLRRVERYFTHLCAEVRPHLATAGGPVILAQIENEYANVAKRYGEGGQRYLHWVAELARRQGLDIPLIMCEGAAPGMIETVNGHSISDDRVTAFRACHPELPLIWTELWPAWYDTWGYQRHRRSARNIAWHLLRFLGHGGAGFNYYMWHGGTNFGRTSMYLQTTSYDFDAPLDEAGRITPKGAYLAQLHHVLAAQADVLLSGECRRDVQPDGTVHIAWHYGEQRLRLELQPDTERAVLRTGTGAVLFDSHAEPTTTFPGWSTAIVPTDWRRWREPLPSARPDAPVVTALPVEQLLLTHDATDYCWYSSTVTLATAGRHALELMRGGDVFAVYLDGRCVARSRPPFLENRGPTLSGTAADTSVNLLEAQGGDAFHHRFHFRATAGEHQLDILAVSLGLIKGDWQVAGPMIIERKGLWGPVLLDGSDVRDWRMHPGLWGERLALPELPHAVRWQSAPADCRPRPLTWYETVFDLTTDQLAADADFRLAADGLGKGHLYLNGHALGRHWLIVADGYGADAGWHKVKVDGLRLEPVGEPTQRCYHLPRAWLLERNRLVICEEFACAPHHVTVEWRLWPAAH